jgi:deoxyadenosine/deoxycytidine kinase
MGRLVMVVGNSGAGKTTLVNALAEAAPFAVGREQHAERPFQALMKADPPRYALANQLDYLLYRAEQERSLRQSPADGLIDGGLDLDYYGFTHLFHHKGYLSDAEFALCERLYRQLRLGLGPPDLIVRLVVPLDVVAQRYARRGRPLEIAARQDLAALGRFVDGWLDRLPASSVLSIDAVADELIDPDTVELLSERINLGLRQQPRTDSTS